MRSDNLDEGIYISLNPRSNLERRVASLNKSIIIIIEQSGVKDKEVNATWPEYEQVQQMTFYETASLLPLRSLSALMYLPVRPRWCSYDLCEAFCQHRVP